MGRFRHISRVITYVSGVPAPDEDVCAGARTQYLRVSDPYIL